MFYIFIIEKLDTQSSQHWNVAEGTLILVLYTQVDNWE